VYAEEKRWVLLNREPNINRFSVGTADINDLGQSFVVNTLDTFQNQWIRRRVADARLPSSRKLYGYFTAGSFDPSSTVSSDPATDANKRCSESCEVNSQQRLAEPIAEALEYRYYKPRPKQITKTTTTS